jgi:nitronate monooxygenase
VSEAGALGIVQPIALTYVHGHEFRAGLRFIKSLTAKPIGFNALIEGTTSSTRSG